MLKHLHILTCHAQVLERLKAVHRNDVLTGIELVLHLLCSLLHLFFIQEAVGECALSLRGLLLADDALNATALGCCLQRLRAQGAIKRQRVVSISQCWNAPAVRVAEGVREVQHVRGWNVGLSNIAVVGQIYDAGVCGIVDVIAALTHQPQTRRETELIALHIYEAVTIHDTLNLHQPP